MNYLSAAFYSNVVLASGLAVLAYIVTRIWRNPHLAHALWLLVLVKLITPPLWQIRLPTARMVSSPAESFNHETFQRRHAAVNLLPEHRVGGNLPANDKAAAGDELIAPVASLAAKSPTKRQITADALVRSPDEDKVQQAGKPQWSTGPASVAPSAKGSVSFELVTNWLITVWGIGAALLVFVAIHKHRRLLRIVANATEADHELRSIAQRVAVQMDVAACPQVRVTSARISPLVVAGSWRRLILLPSRLLDELDNTQLEAVLAHELAHVRRRDHLVRWFEVLVLTWQWWNPLAWYASRRLRQAEEECCDALVVTAMPHNRRSYGQALLRTVEFLTEGQAVATVGGSAFGEFLFQKRIELIMNQKTHTSLSWVARSLLLLLAVAVLPIATVISQDSPARAQQQETVAADVLESEPETQQEPRTSTTPLRANSQPNVQQALAPTETLPTTLWEVILINNNQPTTFERTGSLRKYLLDMPNATLADIRLHASKSMGLSVDTIQYTSLNSIRPHDKLLHRTAKQLKPGEVSEILTEDDSLVIVRRITAQGALESATLKALAKEAQLSEAQVKSIIIALSSTNHSQNQEPQRQQSRVIPPIKTETQPSLAKPLPDTTAFGPNHPLTLRAESNRRQQLLQSRREYEAELRVLELGIRAAELKSLAARQKLKRAQTLNPRNAGVISETEFQETQLAADLTEIDVERAKAEFELFRARFPEFSENNDAETAPKANNVPQR